MFIHGKFYERNAGCMQVVDDVVHGIDAWVHVMCTAYAGCISASQFNKRSIPGLLSIILSADYS